MSAPLNVARGEKHYRYKGGKPDCKDCGVKLKGYRQQRCRPCMAASPEFREKVRVAIRKLVTEGKHNWGDGTKTNLMVKVRSALSRRKLYFQVFTRDGFACVLCGAETHDLQADHIKPVSVILAENNAKTLEDALGCPEIWDLANLRTLCKPCHRSTETWGPGAQRMVMKLKQIV